MGIRIRCHGLYAFCCSFRRHFQNAPSAHNFSVRRVCGFVWHSNSSTNAMHWMGCGVMHFGCALVSCYWLRLACSLFINQYIFKVDFINVCNAMQLHTHSLTHTQTHTLSIPIINAHVCAEFYVSGFSVFLPFLGRKSYSTIPFNRMMI